MKNFKWLALSIYLTLLLVPIIMNSFFGYKSDKPDINNIDSSRQDIFNMEISLYRSESEKIENLSCFEYICCVVAGEMPASFESEALKAQTVAAFTYMINKIDYINAHPDTDIGHHGAYMCDDYNHCKAYLSKSDAKEKWGSSFEKNYSKVKSAVYETLGKVITYEGTPINSVFHAMSCGKTASAYEVWGSDIPYLQSVECESDKTEQNFLTEQTISKNDFKNVFYEQLGIVLSDDDNLWIGEKTNFPSGIVDKIIIGGTEYAGTYIRKLFGLRSADFDISIKGNNVIFTTRGYGHGVGMSQYGANAMAKNGSTYQDILKHFYRGVEITDYKNQKTV